LSSGHSSRLKPPHLISFLVRRDENPLLERSKSEHGGQAGFKNSETRKSLGSLRSPSKQGGRPIRVPRVGSLCVACAFGAGPCVSCVFSALLYFFGVCAVCDVLWCESCKSHVSSRRPRCPRIWVVGLCAFLGRACEVSAFSAFVLSCAFVCPVVCLLSGIACVRRRHTEKKRGTAVAKGAGWSL
jgi:hypothetical protein